MGSNIDINKRGNSMEEDTRQILRMILSDLTNQELITAEEALLAEKQYVKLATSAESGNDAA